MSEPTLTSSKINLWLLAAAAFAALLALHLSGIPKTLWEYDECLFAHGVESYEPLAHHPPPPGYPIYIGFAQLVALLTGDPFHALVAISTIATFLGAIALFFAFRAVTGKPHAALAGAILFYFSPTMLVHGTLALGDSGALALLAVAVWLSARSMTSESVRITMAMALVCAVTVGWRQQFAIAIVPLFFVTLLFVRSWRTRVLALGVFGVACVAWLAPLVAATGGVGGFWRWLSGQAAYFAQHDADLSRSGQSMASIMLRFIAHPWGPKWLSGGFLLAAFIGAIATLLAMRNAPGKADVRRLLPLVAMTVVYLAFCIAMMDPADAVRYALPGLPGLALAAGLGIDWLRERAKGLPVEWLPLGAYVAGAFLYVTPILHERSTSASPPFAAIEHLHEIAPRNAIVLADLALRPHADYLLRGFRRMRIDEGLARYGLATDVPIYVLADGEARGNGTTFRWPESDAYGKLTRRHYRAVSVIPIPPSQRFLAIEGIHPPERTSDGRAWRWLGAKATLQLAPIGASRVRLTFDTPPDYPIASNRVVIESEGRTLASVDVVPNRPSTIALDLPPGASRLTLRPEKTFVPMEVPGKRSRDRRRLSVMLTGVEQLTR